MEPRYRRPSSPGSRRLVNPMRSTTGSVGYSSPYDPYYPGPRSSLRDVAPIPRGGVQPIGGVERIPADPGRSAPRVVQREMPTTSQNRGDLVIRPRRASLDRDSDGGRRPANILPSATSGRTRPIIHTNTGPGVDGPLSPLARTRHPTDNEDYYVQPASSGRRNEHRRIYSLDSNDVERGVRSRDNQIAKVSNEGMERGGYRSSGLANGRRGYNLKGPLVRRADAESDDYGYSYTNPKEQMYRDIAPRARPRRDSYAAQQQARRLSMTGMEDYLPGGPMNRDAGPPPSTRQFDRLGGVGRSSSLKQSPHYPVNNRSRVYSPSREMDPYDAPSRRLAPNPVSIHHRRDDEYESDLEGYDEPDRRDQRQRRARHYDDQIPTRGFGIREPELDRDSTRGNDVDRYDPKPKEPRFADGPPKIINNGLSRKEERDDRSLQMRDPRDREYGGEDALDHDRRGRRPRDADIRDRDSNEDAKRDIELRDLRKREVQELKDSYRGPHENNIPDPERHRRETRKKEHSDQEYETDDDDRRDRERRRRARRERKARGRDGLISDPRDGDSRDVGVPEPEQRYPRDYIEGESRHRDHLNKEPHERGHERDPRYKEPREMESSERLLENGEPLVGEPEDVQPERQVRVRVVSPAREKEPEQPVKGILRPPRDKFPEDPAPIREGVAPLKDAGKKGIPPGARWTKIDRKLVNPAALEEAHERFEERLDYVIVLRVLTKEDIEGFAARTQRIRDERYAEEKRDRQRRRDEPRAIEDARPDLRAIEAPPDSRTATNLTEPHPNQVDSAVDENLRENPDAPGTYVGYQRNPPPVRQPQQYYMSGGSGR